MTAIRHALQKAFFEPDDQRLLSVINVIDPKKRKKNYFLCLAVTNSPPLTVSLCRIKNVAEIDSSERKDTWQLRDIRVVDGINPRKAVAEFILTIGDKVWRWEATNIAEKEPFIKQLYKASDRYLNKLLQKPEFINLPAYQYVPVDGGVVGVSGVDSDSSSQREETPDDYQPLTAKEEADFRRLLVQANLSVGQADVFSEQLTKQLASLDAANLSVGQADMFSEQLTKQLASLDAKNMHAIMGSEQTVAELMNVIDAALEQVEKIETQLDQMDELLGHVRDSVDMMGEKDSMAQTENGNRQRLISDLHGFLTAVEFPDDYVRPLRECKLSNGQEITKCTRAAQTLSKCLTAHISPGMEKLACYSEQMTKFNKLADEFAEKLVSHLSVTFQNLTDQLSESVGQWHALSLPKHSQRHHALQPFADLVLWLKQTRPQGHKMLLERYVTYSKETYQRDLDRFFNALNVELRNGGAPERKASTLGGANRSFNTLDSSRISDRSRAGSDLDVSPHGQFAKLAETMLSEIDPVVVAETKFCLRFFHLSQDILITAETQSTESGSNDSSSVGNDRRAERLFNAEVRAVLANLFGHLDRQLANFVDQSATKNPVYSMVLLVLLSKKVLSLTDSGSYIAVILGSAVVISKRKFDSFMETECQQMAEFKLSKRTRIGILDSVKRFQELCIAAESAFGSCERRKDLDRWYPAFIDAVCASIERAAVDPNSKAPGNVVRMENYHRLHSILSEQKVSCLETKRKEIKQKYQVALNGYVKESMGRPLDKLQNFFEQVDRAIEMGVAPTEIGYQSQFSKNELKAKIAMYPGKEVKKGLESLYKRVEKQLTDSDDSGLMQVVWRNMQEEFVQLVKHFDQVIGQCYPSGIIDLDFTINDVLQYFSDIAMQH